MNWDLHILSDELITEANKEADFYIEKIQISPSTQLRKTSSLRLPRDYRGNILKCFLVIFLKRNDEYENIKNYSDLSTEYTFFSLCSATVILKMNVIGVLVLEGLILTTVCEYIHILKNTLKNNGI